ncbi:MAG: apolipoprotein N-acyltransferase [Pseudomonadota bacterium]
MPAVLKTRVVARLIAFACGAVFAFGFAPTSFLPGAFLALSVWAAVLFNAPRKRDAFWLGYLFGAGQFLINFFWIANAFSVREGFSYGQGLAAVIALALVMALYPGLAALVAQWLRGRTWRPLTFALGLSITWLCAELARAYVLTGFPWNPVGVLWASALPIAQLASLVGVFGVSALTVLLAALLGAGVLHASPIRAKAMYVGGALCVLGGAWGWGMSRIPAGTLPVFEDMQLVLVQANIAQKDKWSRPLLEQHLRTHIRLSNEAVVEPGKRKVVIWPETAYPYLIENAPSSQRQLQTEIGQTTTLLFGANRLVEDAGKQTARNTLFVLAGGQLVERYDKTHLVPFGEYVPYASALSKLGISALVEALTGFLPGPGPVLIESDGLPAVAPLICYEGIFPRVLTALPQRPEWILNVSNDAWFGASAGPYQHMDLARFRAIEHGAALARGTGTGVSAVFDPYGRITRFLPLGEQGALVSPLPRPLVAVPAFSSTNGRSLFYFLFALVISFAFSRFYHNEEAPPL